MNHSLIRDLVGDLDLPPPGSCSDFVDHPSGRREAVEIATVQEHRFAFYFWLRWRFKNAPVDEGTAVLRKPTAPDLLTVDWHNDVGGDADVNPQVLRRLNPRDSTELGLFCWLGLCALNDGQILPAVHLNAVGDVHVILKQGTPRRKRRWNGTMLHRKDRFGFEHVIRYYSSPNQFLEQNKGSEFRRTIFDLDLDYFTEYAGTDHPTHQSARLVPDRTVQSLLNPAGEFMQWVQPRLVGMTIALEPEYCGGIINCFHLLSIVSETLFDPPLFRAGWTWRKPRG